MSVKRSVFRELMQRHQDAVFSYALHLLRNRADAEDITQEALLRMWRGMGTFNPLKARAWIMRVTHNLCVDLIRWRDAAGGGIHLAAPAEIEETVLLDDRPDPSRLAEHALLRRDIDAAIATLPPAQQHIFMLRELHGLKHAEIARTLDLPVGTVKVYLHRARRHLRDQLIAYDTDTRHP